MKQVILCKALRDVVKKVVQQHGETRGRSIRNDLLYDFKMIEEHLERGTLFDLGYSVAYLEKRLRAYDILEIDTVLDQWVAFFSLWQMWSSIYANRLLYRVPFTGCSDLVYERV
jgi:hypothetical protein